MLFIYVALYRLRFRRLKNRIITVVTSVNYVYLSGLSVSEHEECVFKHIHLKYSLILRLRTEIELFMFNYLEISLFFNNIGNAPEAAALAKACRAGRTVKVDMGELFWLDENGNEKRHGFIIIAGSGFDAEIMMKAAPTKNDIGEIAYFLSALATPNPTVAHFTIEHDGIVEELDGICCMAGNTSVIQNDINLFPDCRMNDGMVDIAVIEPVKTVQLLPTVITAALDPAGKVLGRPQFKIIQTKEAKITCTPSLGMQFDGEIISSNSGVFGARALPQCLDLIVDEFSPLGK